ncbi:CGNR zinc finger domain-containing protein [Microvirga massiliensis]|uniref:CGNR zinc finger domain-containing protein n=1 Tax=Microvirga massiliensis TaxID=1033741 RepID=UPI00062BEE1C|nr:ABATE domain-containing protein [Microvirga massiliensis]
MVINSEYCPSAPSRADSLGLIGGALALDFANTASGRGSDSHLEHLRAPEHVILWAEHAGIVDSRTARRLMDRLAERDPAFGSLLEDALALREAIHRVISALAHGVGPAQADLAVIKDSCARAIAAAELSPNAEGFRWTWPIDPPRPDILLGPVALSATGLLRESDLSRIKQCAGEHCGWVFFDLTKNKSRRWCEMSVCGNRAKARRFARRMRSGNGDR